MSGRGGPFDCNGPMGIPASEARGGSGYATLKFGSLTAADALTLSVNAGEVFGLLGSNGAGKTTTIGMLTTS
jgi:ABC-type Fe3+/spermidine/putrescine transport system ATPase subunit